MVTHFILIYKNRIASKYIVISILTGVMIFVVVGQLMGSFKTTFSNPIRHRMDTIFID
jgi:predicted cobalt transporter CbtA